MAPERFHQQIPRPTGVLQRNSPPWSSLTPQRRSHVPLAAVAKAFPLVDARSVVLGPTRAAVLAGVLEDEGEAHLLLTRSSLTLVRDPGLVSFPGGYIESGEHPLDAALREAREEIGLEPQCVEVRDCLGSVERPRSGAPVVGYLGLVSSDAVFDPNSDEVDALFSVPLRDLLAEGAAWSEEWGTGVGVRQIHFFTSPATMGDNLVWGITAKLVWDVLAAVAGVLAER